MGRLDIDSLLTIIPFEMTLKPSKFSIVIFFKKNGIVHGLKKNEHKHLVSLATKESYFIFNNIIQTN